MSLLFSSTEGWIVSHLQYINEVYKNVKSELRICTLKFDGSLFEINSQYLRQNQIVHTDQNEEVGSQTKTKKRKRLKSSSADDSEEINYIKHAFSKIISSAKAEGLFCGDVISDNNELARSAARKFYIDTFRDTSENFHGCNNTEATIVQGMHYKEYVFPKKCTFYCYDIRDITKKIEPNNQYDFILLDPPWWNKSIRRKKSKHVEASYKMMYNEELVKIPIGKLLNSSGIVAIWCTNAPSHLNSIFNEIFPSWGVTYIAKWYWIKITKAGETVCNFNIGQGKQPYELLLLGSAKNKLEMNIPEHKLLVSVPSAVHSHKPPLTEIIKEYLPNEPTCLEIFARYLIPGWTSWGLEVLKFQHLSLYTVVNETKEDNSVTSVNTN